MEKRKNTNSRLAAWIVNKVKTEYSNDISLVVMYGSHINGTAGSKSDLDCYFVPKTQRGLNLARTFILDGVGYDLYPIFWERLEQIADLQESMSTLIGDVEILYCGTPEDAARFQALQNRLKHNLSDKEYVRNIAVKRLRNAGNLCALLDTACNVSQARKLAGRMIMTLADAVAVYNQDYFHRGLKKQFEDLQYRFTDIPRTIVKDYQNAVESEHMEDVIRCTKRMFDGVCDYLNISYIPQETVQQEDFSCHPVNASVLAGLYEEISSTFLKIYDSCDADNHILAFLSAVCLQWELDDAAVYGIPSFDLLGHFSCHKLQRLSEAAKNAEAELVRLITANGGHLHIFENFEQFEAAFL